MYKKRKYLLILLTSRIGQLDLSSVNWVKLCALKRSYILQLPFYEQNALHYILV